MDKICIILQGYITDKKTLIDIIKYYKSLNINNIIVSTYDILISKELKELVPVIYYNTKKINTKYCIYDIKNNMKIYNDICKNTKNRLINSLNLQLLTTKAGIKLANEKYPNTEYFMKLRMDMKIEKLNKYLLKWIDIISNSNKLVSYGYRYFRNRCKYYFYFYDYWLFGFKNDIKKYYNIPFITSKNKMKQLFYPLCETYLASYHYKNYCKLNLDKHKINEKRYNYIIKNKFIFDNTMNIYWYRMNKYILKGDNDKVINDKNIIRNNLYHLF